MCLVHAQNNVFNTRRPHAVDRHGSINAEWRRRFTLDFTCTRGAACFRFTRSRCVIFVCWPTKKRTSIERKRRRDYTTTTTTTTHPSANTRRCIVFRNVMELQTRRIIVSVRSGDRTRPIRLRLADFNKTTKADRATGVAFQTFSGAYASGTETNVDNALACKNNVEKRDLDGTRGVFGVNFDSE